MGNPPRSRKPFSRIRSWAIATASTEGRTRHARARRSSASAGTFSNSVVTAAHARGELVERVRVGVGGAQVGVGDLAGGTRGVGVEHDDPVAHRPGADGEHPAQLPSAQDAERGAGQDHERSRGS